MEFESNPNEEGTQSYFIVFKKTTGLGTNAFCQFWVRNDSTGHEEMYDRKDLSGKDYNYFIEMMKLDKSGIVKRAWDNLAKNFDKKINVPVEWINILRKKGYLQKI